jgi:hypothetical protein
VKTRAAAAAPEEGVSEVDVVRVVPSVEAWALIASRGAIKYGNSGVPTLFHVSFSFHPIFGQEGKHKPLLKSHYHISDPHTHLLPVDSKSNYTPPPPSWQVSSTATHYPHS